MNGSDRMPEILFKTEKNKTVKESGFKIGDILVGTTHWYRTATYWYQVIGVTEKQVKLKELNICYPTEYMSNTPGSECMPVLEFVNESKGIRKYFPAAGFPYWSKTREGFVFKGSISKVNRIERSWKKDSDDYDDYEDKIVDSYYEVTIIGQGKYYPSFTLWDGRPGWVNCD